MTPEEQAALAAALRDRPQVEEVYQGWDWESPSNWDWAAPVASQAAGIGIGAGGLIANEKIQETGREMRDAADVREMRSLGGYDRLSDAQKGHFQRRSFTVPRSAKWIGRSFAGAGVMGMVASAIASALLGDHEFRKKLSERSSNKETQ